MVLESNFQGEFIKELKALFPGCIVLKNDSSYQGGIPDLIILFEDRWATFEVKRSPNEKPRPNQPYFVEKMNEMSFSAFVFPENKEDVLVQLQHAFGTSRKSRRTQR